MNKTIIFYAFLFFVLVQSSYAQDKTSQLIGNNVAVFYPANYDASQNEPSFALIKEPQPAGEIPHDWVLKPHFYSKSGKSIATLVINKGTDLYGTGEVTGSFRRNGTKVTLWNTDNFTYKKHNGERLYQSHPWVLGVNRDGTAFGIIADNTWKQELDLSDSIRFISDAPAFRVIIIQRNNPQEVVKELANLIGKMEMPPLWALGYQQCRWSYIPDTRIKNIADTFRLKKIPCDVIWMDIDYMDKYKIFTFDPIKIPNPKGLNDYLHQKGFHSIWMIDPGVKAEKGYSIYESGSKVDCWVQDKSHSEFNGDVWPGKCAFPDFTRPETRLWWGGLYENFMSQGVDGVWNDMNEPSVFGGPDDTMPEENWHRGGEGIPAGNHTRYHNIYGMLMVKASRDGILKANPEKRPFILSRSGFLGSNRYTATWTGDNNATDEHMRMSIPMTLNLGLSGQAFNGPDLGGFAGITTPELFGQWVSFGVFFPFVRGHACNGTNNKEPWVFGREVETISRTALNRRYQLLPYYYTLFHEAATNGMPIMRPVFFAAPEDTTLRKEEQAFLVGDNLLVIPRWAVNPTLPKGIWRSVPFAGENTTSNISQADVKIKEGTIIPLGKIIQNTNEYNSDSLTLIVSLDQKGEARGTLYEDAGDGFGYTKGEYLLSNLLAKQVGDKVDVKISVEAGNLKTRKRSFKVVVLKAK